MAHALSWLGAEFQPVVLVKTDAEKYRFWSIMQNHLWRCWLALASFFQHDQNNLLMQQNISGQKNRQWSTIRHGLASPEPGSQCYQNTIVSVGRDWNKNQPILNSISKRELWRSFKKPEKLFLKTTFLTLDAYSSWFLVLFSKLSSFCDISSLLLEQNDWAMLQQFVREICAYTVY